MTRSFVLLWNPRKFVWEDLPDDIDRLATTGTFSMFWSAGNRKDLPIGSRIYLMRLGAEPKGLVGSGISTSKPERGGHWKHDLANADQPMLGVDVEFDVLEQTPVIPIAQLMKGRLGAFRSWTPQSGGVEIPTEIAAHLARLWAQKTTRVVGSNRAPEEARSYPEGALRTITTNAYERSTRARQECLAHHGTRCAVCGFSGSERYGRAFEGLIHVHHIRPISELPQNYQVDPVRDLVPICPNCHAAIHWKRTATTIAELRKLLAGKSRR